MATLAPLATPMLEVLIQDCPNLTKHKNNFLKLALLETKISFWFLEGPVLGSRFALILKSLNC